MNKDVKIFDISQKRPDVLLVGNGLTYNAETEWGKIISRLSRSGAPQINTSGIPYSVLAGIETSIDDKTRHNKYENFFKKEYSYRKFPNLEKLMEVPFDAVLTTNYTYEIEDALLDGFHNMSESTQKSHVFWTKAKPDAKYLLHGFGRFEKNGITQDIWHIHGEARRKSSIILTHDEYARLIGKILEYNSTRGNDYSKYKEAVRFKSWVDYLILGDLHILGFGFDFSEFDLWWLLTRRLKETTGHGTVTFYSPKKIDQKSADIEQALESMGVEVDHCGIEIPDSCENKSELYNRFYEQAIKIIGEKMNYGNI